MLVRIISQNESAAISGGSNSYKYESYFKGGDDKKYGYRHGEKREYEKTTSTAIMMTISPTVLTAGGADCATFRGQGQAITA